MALGGRPAYGDHGHDHSDRARLMIAAAASTHDRNGSDRAARVRWPRVRSCFEAQTVRLQVLPPSPLPSPVVGPPAVARGRGAGRAGWLWRRRSARRPRRLVPGLGALLLLPPLSPVTTRGEREAGEETVDEPGRQGRTGARAGEDRRKTATAGEGENRRRRAPTKAPSQPASHPAAVGSATAVANAASARHVDTCGVRFPRRISDADAFEQTAASMISDNFTVASLGRMSLRNNSGS